MLNFKPLGNQVVVELDKAEEMKGSIILPSQAVKAPVTGKVIACGSGKIMTNGNKVDMTVKIGDKVMFGQFAGNEIQYQDNTYFVMSEEDIMAIVEEAQ